MYWTVRSAEEAFAILHNHASVFEWLTSHRRLEVLCTGEDSTVTSAPEQIICQQWERSCSAGATQPSPGIAIAASLLGAVVGIVLCEGALNNWRRYHPPKSEGDIEWWQQSWFAGLVLMVVPYLAAFAFALAVVGLSRQRGEPSEATQKKKITGSNASIDRSQNCTSFRFKQALSASRLDLNAIVAQAQEEASANDFNRAAVIVSGSRNFRRSAKRSCLRESALRQPVAHYLSFSFEL